MTFKLANPKKLVKELGSTKAAVLCVRLDKHIKKNGVENEMILFPFEKIVRHKTVPIQCNFFVQGETAGGTILLEYLESEKRTDECIAV